jgi:hypothetical protein
MRWLTIEGAPLFLPCGAVRAMSPLLGLGRGGGSAPPESEGNLLPAESCFTRAIAVARRQHAKLWDLRAATSLSRLWRDQNRIVDARSILASVYGWFTEGLDTVLLREAKVLLNELERVDVKPY